MSPCIAEDIDCRVKGPYIKSGNPYYHGELCTGCLWWKDTEADLAFKARVKEITDPRNFRERPLDRW